MTEQGVRTVLREAMPLLRSAEHVSRRTFTTARHIATKAKNSAQVYLEYDLPNALERAFAPGGYSKAERELLLYDSVFEPSSGEFWGLSSRDFLVHPTRTAQLTRASREPHIAPAPSYTVPSDAVLSGESPFLFPDLPISTRPMQVPLWDVRGSTSGASNYVASVFQETSYTRPTVPVLKQASLFATEPSYVLQEVGLMTLQQNKFLEEIVFGRVRLINNRLPINAEYAGSVYPLEKLPLELRGKYPHSVPFTGTGHPDFSRYAVRKVKIEMTGQTTDFSLADKVAGFTKRPDGYTWHHHHDGETMLLIPIEIHEAVRHTGGAAIIRNKTIR